MSKPIRTIFALSLFAFALAHSPLVQAATDDEDDTIGYEDIVKDLAQEQRKAAENTSRAKMKASGNQTSLDDVMFHGGVGLSQMFGTINYDGQHVHLSQQGIQAKLGLDLFSDYWMAEGTARNFTGTDYKSANVALKEFDLKIIYHDHLAPKIGYRIGAGLAARYLRVADLTTSQDYKTPSSVFSAGLDLILSRTISVGAELGTRSALISETIDKNTYDMTFGLDATF